MRIYIYIYVYIYIHIYIFINIYVYVCMYIHIHVYMYIHIYICIYIYMYIYKQMYITFVHMYTHTYIYLIIFMYWNIFVCSVCTGATAARSAATTAAQTGRDGTHERVLSQIWMSHVPHTQLQRQRDRRLLWQHKQAGKAHMNESRPKYERVMSHIHRCNGRRIYCNYNHTNSPSRHT